MIAVNVGAGIFGAGAATVRSLIGRPLLVGALEDHIGRGALIVLCAEPGMGKDDALESARVVGKQFGARTHTIDLTGYAGGAACEKMARAGRSLLRRMLTVEWAVVCVRGIPALDERCIHRMKAHIDRLRGRDCCVVLSLRPEAFQLAEVFSDAFVMWSDDLCMVPSSHLDVSAAEEVRQLTGGVPLLVGSLHATERDGAWEIRAGREYHDALRTALSLSLRDALITDERKLRLAMLLLGSGTFEQVGDVVGTLDIELLQDVCRYAPLFGVDLAQSSFSCAGLCRDEWLRANLFTLGEICGDYDALCSRAVRALLKEGRYTRAASVLELCADNEDAAVSTLRWSVELVNVGCADIVRRELVLAQRFRLCTPQLRQACQTLIKLVDNTRLEASDIDLDPYSVAIDCEREEVHRIKILLAARLAWQGRPIKLPSDAATLPDAIARDLVLHLSVTNALIEGRGHAAYHLLVCGSQLTGKDTLTGQLLEADLAFAHVLMGLPFPSASAEAYAHDMDGACMLCYLPAVEAIDRVWRRGESTCTLSKLDVHAAQAGDELVLAHLLLAAALANARCGAVSHAIVKCNRARAIARRAGAAHVADAAQIVCWAARINGGDLPSKAEFAGSELMGPAMKLLASVLALAAEGVREPAPHLSETTLDRDIVWLASALLTGLTKLSPVLEQIMPATWLVVIEGMRAREEDDRAYLVSQRHDRLPTDEPEHLIYVRLLGGFEVYVNGRQLPVGSFARRRAKSLITYVCSTNKGTLRRADIIDAVWPECNYEQGAKRIYAATNVINRAVRGFDEECSFFAARGNDHSLRLNVACVRSDVQEFEELAHRAIECEGNDDEVLSLVRAAQSLYRGDLYVPPGEAGRVVDRRRVDLRGLYTDVLIAGAEAAFRRGSLRLSTRLCEQALLADETREDAIACLVRSLASCGRTVEARDRSKAFAARMGVLRRERANRERTA